MICITKDMVVAMRYIMRNSKGVVLEDTMNAAPINYLHGSNEIQALLQAQLEGAKKGDKKTVYLSKEYGFTDDDFSFEVIIDNVRAALPDEIALGYPIQLHIDRCEISCECYSGLNLQSIL